MNQFSAVHMRAAHILRKYQPAEWGGTETAVQQLLDGLARQEVRNTVYAPRLKEPPESDPIAADGHAVKRYKAAVPVMNLEPEQREQLIAIGGNLLSFDLAPRLLLERGLDVIHSHALNRIGGAALTAAKIRKLPFLVTIHGGVLDLPRSVQATLAAPLEGGFEWGRIFGALFRSRAVLKEADAIITCNPREAALQKEKFPEKRVLVQPHGVPVERYKQDFRGRAADAFPIIRGQRMILIAGRIDPVKNQGWVMEQLPRILRKFPDAMLVLAGPCTDELYGKAIRKEIRRLGLDHKVLLTGGLPPGDPRLIGLMQQAAVAAVPSLSETFGLIILEAWAAGAPVISTRTSGAFSIIQENENALLFDLADPETFHQAAASLFENPELGRKLAENGHQLAAREYDTVLLSKRIKSLYDDLIREKKRP